MWDTPGGIFETVLTIDGKQPSTSLVKSSFRSVDRGGRRQLDLATKKLIPTPPKAALRIDSGESIADALDRFASHTGTSWGQNRQGRFYLDTPDFDAHNLVENGFFELDAASVWPWFGEQNAALPVSTARSFAVSKNSLEISNGSNAGAYAKQRVLFPRAGHYVVTLCVVSVSGDSSAFHVGVLPPDGEEQLSLAHAISTTDWTRVTFPVCIDRGHVGQTEIRLYPAKGVATPVVVGVDAIEGYHLAAIAEHNNSEIVSIEYDDAYETLVGFSRNQQDGRHLTARAGHAEALGLSTTEPEGKHVVGSAGVIDLTDALIPDASSALGIGSPLTATHGRQRQRMEIIMKGLNRIPILGDRIIHRNHPRVPETSDLHPVWRIVNSSYQAGKPQDVLLTVRRQVDPAVDRMEIT